jgi:hypothetical protein
MDTKIGQWLLMGMLRPSAGGFCPGSPEHVGNEHPANGSDARRLA